MGSLTFNYKYYLFTEILLYGGLCIYLTSLFPELTTFFLYQCSYCANSKHLSYYWTAPITVLQQLEFLWLRQVIAIGLWSPIMDSHM